MSKKKKQEKKNGLIVSGIKKGLKALKDSHNSYVLKGLIAEATSEDKSTRLSAIAQLKKDFPDVYKEIKSELKSK